MRNIITLGPETADHHGIFVFMQQHTTAFLENRYEFISWNFCRVFSLLLYKKPYAFTRIKLFVRTFRSIHSISCLCKRFLTFKMGRISHLNPHSKMLICLITAKTLLLNHAWDKAK